MKNEHVICPYCGKEMVRYFDMSWCWYECIECGAQSPNGTSEDEAYEKAKCRYVLPVKPLTLKEAIAFDDHPIWCEYRKIGLGFWTDVVLNHRDGRVVLRRYPPVPFYFEDADKYNVEYRCWARRPTDEERAAAVWEVE